MKRIVILGSTGSIGTQALDIIERLSERFEVVGLAGNANVELLAKQANQFRVKHVSIGTENLVPDLKTRVDRKSVV